MAAPEESVENADVPKVDVEKGDDESSVNNGHSLPVYSEIEGETKKTSSSRRSIIIGIVILALTLAVIGLSVVVVKRGSGSSSAAAAQGSSQSQNFGGASNNPVFNPTPVDQGSDPVLEKDPEAEITAPEDLVTATTTEEEDDGEPATKLEIITEFLVNRGVASRYDLETAGSYAHQAAMWIAHEDELKLAIPMTSERTKSADPSPLTTEETFIMRFVMAHIYYALGGPKWSNQANFLSGKHVCEWTEVVATQVGTLPVGVGCTPQDGRVRALWLNGNKLQNQLPSQLGLLTDLRMLDLDLNFIQGKLPDSLQSLTAMEHLHIGSAGLTGTLPSWIGAFSNLGSLNLGYNVMHGTLPSELKNLSALKELALDNNAFEGDVNVLFSSGGLSSLTQLFLDSNSFVGELGDDFVSDMVNLTQLDLSDNAFSGTVPKHFFEFQKLGVLDIHDNDFTALPSSIANSTSLKFFAAQKNALVGNMDEIIGLRALTHLDLSQNKMTGAIPDTIGDEIVGLNYLFLAENDFDAGKIPFSISNLFSLKELSLKSTSRTGVIPPIMGMMSELVFLDLDNNFLDGEIPNTLGSLTNLQLLLLNRNNLVNAVPSEFGKLAKLETLFLEGNALTGGLEFACNSMPADYPRDIIAQCSLCDTVPGCCTECCQDGVTCNTNTHVADLDPIWQLSYERYDYELGKENLWR